MVANQPPFLLYNYWVQLRIIIKKKHKPQNYLFLLWLMFLLYISITSGPAL